MPRGRKGKKLPADIICRAAKSHNANSDGFIDDPKHWRARAAEMRVLAYEIKDTDAKVIMLRLVKDYDWLVDWADVQRKKRDQNSN
jgi:hypothetical protein